MKNKNIKMILLPFTAWEQPLWCIVSTIIFCIELFIGWRINSEPLSKVSWDFWVAGFVGMYCIHWLISAVVVVAIVVNENNKYDE